MGYPSHGSCKRLTDRGVVRVWLRVWLRVWWQGSRLTYGLNYLDTTWDYNKVTGCVCDHDGSYNKSSTTYTGTSTGDILDYKGYDCSLREYQVQVAHRQGPAFNQVCAQARAQRATTLCRRL